MWLHSLSLLPWMFLYCIYFFVSTIECCGANMCMYCVRYPSLALGTYCSHGIWRKLMQFVLLLHSKTNISLSWSNPSPFFSVFFNSFILNSSLLHLFFFTKNNRYSNQVPWKLRTTRKSQRISVNNSWKKHLKTFALMFTDKYVLISSVLCSLRIKMIFKQENVVKKINESMRIYAYT